MTENRVENGRIQILLDGKLYSKEAIFKCLYWYGDNFRTNVSTDERGNFNIVLEPLETEKFTSEKLKKYLVKLERDFVDFNLRDIVSKETKNIRDLLVAKAFSHGEFDEEPPGEISDPVGYDVND